MSLEFLKFYRGCRLDPSNLEPSFEDQLILDEDEQNPEEKVIMTYETEKWEAINISDQLPNNWRVQQWKNSPKRFVDGKDVGQTIAWVYAPQGQLIPIRLSQIGSIAMRIENGECRREFHVIERVISMEADLFPWTEIEGFAAALQTHGFRLLTRLITNSPEEKDTYNFEKMRQISQNRTRIEMQALEEAAIAFNGHELTVIDGPLTNLRGGIDHDRSPVIGVIKKPRKYHLDFSDKQLLYQLEIGQRTPVFHLPKTAKRPLPVVTWYIRLSDAKQALPSGGIVRIEIGESWFEKHHKNDWDFVNKISRTLYDYRCREQSYDRSKVSLHPTVRGEESLGALLTPLTLLTHRFYHLTGL